MGADRHASIAGYCRELVDSDGEARVREERRDCGHVVPWVQITAGSTPGLIDVAQRLQ